MTYTVTFTGSINAKDEAEAIRTFATLTTEMLRIETSEAQLVKDTKGKERFLLRIDVKSSEGAESGHERTQNTVDA